MAGPQPQPQPTWWASETQDAEWAMHCLRGELEHLADIRRAAHAGGAAALDPTRMAAVLDALRVHATADPDRSTTHRLVLDDPSIKGDDARCVSYRPLAIARQDLGQTFWPASPKFKFERNLLRENRPHDLGLIAGR